MVIFYTFKSLLKLKSDKLYPIWNTDSNEIIFFKRNGVNKIKVISYIDKTVYQITVYYRLKMEVNVNGFIVFLQFLCIMYERRIWTVKSSHRKPI